MTIEPGTLISTRGEFHAALRLAFTEAASVGCRELWLCDADFADWPLGERVVIEHLAQWAASRRRLTLLARGSGRAGEDAREVENSEAFERAGGILGGHGLVRSDLGGGGGGDVIGSGAA